MKKIETDISNRIAMLRFLMIFGIVILHTPPFVPITTEPNTLFDFIKALFQHAIFRTSVPVLTCISGYLLFKSQLHTQFSQLFIKKTKTIFIPLILFNLPIALFIYYLQFNQLIDHQFSTQLHPIDQTTWINAIFGLTAAPVNYPTNFLRDLYIVSLMTPIFSILLRYIPITGLFIISFFFWFNFDGDIVLRSPMPIMFYFGGLMATTDVNIKSFDKYSAYLLTLFITLCIAIIYFKVENRNYLRLIAPFLIWPASALIVNTWLGKWFIRFSKYSFPIFLMQGPLLLVCWLLYKKFLISIPYWIFWIITPIITAVTLTYLYKLSCIAFPKTMKFVFGGRG